MKNVKRMKVWILSQGTEY